jgi:hypothetical protein
MRGGRHAPLVQVTIVEATGDVEIHVMVQSAKWRWNIGITQVGPLHMAAGAIIGFFAQILCSAVEERAKAAAENVNCGAKNPSK